jgi:hypothetical protein
MSVYAAGVTGMGLQQRIEDEWELIHNIPAIFECAQ